MLDKSCTVLFIPTERELKAVFNIEADNNELGFNFGVINDTPIVVTGISKTNTAMTAALFFHRFKPKTSILIGICGAYQSSYLEVGDVVSIDKDYFVDEGSYDGEYLTSLTEKGMPICDGGVAYFKPYYGLKSVCSNTVSFIPNTTELSELYRLKTGALVENMEGAAFGLAAAMNNIMPYQIRAISNFCGRKEIQQWNIKKACGSLKNTILKII